jgi:hypothetical protein
MKNLFLTLIFCLISILGISQTNKGKSGVNVVLAKTQNVFGVSPGYYVEFTNTSNKKVDAIKWTATFTDNFGEVLGTRDGKWQSGNFISSIEKGESTKDIENNFVKGATKVYIKITLVHFEK